MQNYWPVFSNYWEQYHKVTFDGINKLILINDGETCINFKVDVYSAWKEWMLVETNSGFEKAITAIGGDPTPNGFIGSTFFLENGWKIRTWEGDHTLNLTGNVFARDGSAITVPTVQPHSITLYSTVSNIVDVPNIPIAPVVAGVWGATTADYTTAGTAGKKLDDLPLTGTGDWSETEKENIRYAIGVDGTKTAPTGGSGILGSAFNKLKLILAILFSK